VAASVAYSITFASRSQKNYDVTEAKIANKFVFLYFYVAALCNLVFTICGSYIQQVWPPLPQLVFNSFYSTRTILYDLFIFVDIFRWLFASNWTFTSRFEETFLLSILILFTQCKLHDWLQRTKNNIDLTVKA